jgi:hypothetical protein
MYREKGCALDPPDVDGHEEASADAHAVAVNNSVTEERGQCSIHSCSVHQKQLPLKC